MKTFTRIPFTHWLAAAVFSIGAGSFQTQAQVIPLTHNNSTATIDVTPSSGNNGGMTSWVVDGVNQLRQQWFWFRVGSSGPEAPISSIGTVSTSLVGTRGLYTTYANNQFSVEIDYLLTGFSLGSHNSDISESITIANTSASPLEFHFFQYSNFQLAGGALNNSVTLGKNLRGLFNEASLSKNNNSSVSETVLTPGANHGEAALDPFTFDRLTDGNPTTLNDNMGPTALGDATWAFQWDFMIPAGSSVGISKDKYLHWEPIPEPSTAAILSIGLVAYLAQRRRSSRK